MKKKIIRIILLILIFLWMYIVFGFSNQNGEQSSGLSLRISMFITKNNTELAKTIEPLIRKLAHFSEYGVGGILIYSFVITFEKLKENIKMILSIIIGIIYSISDEIHQLFISGREGKIFDVYIDTLGFIVGILIILLIRKILNCRGRS